MIKRELIENIKDIADDAEIVLGEAVSLPLTGVSTGYFIDFGNGIVSFLPHPDTHPDYYGGTKAGWEWLDQIPEKRFAILLRSDR